MKQLEKIFHQEIKSRRGNNTWDFNIAASVTKTRIKQRNAKIIFSSLATAAAIFLVVISVSISERIRVESPAEKFLAAQATGTFSLGDETSFEISTSFTSGTDHILDETLALR